MISDLKVIPMIRGKGFEFTVSDILKNILPSERWEVSNPIINAQSEVHDIDVLVKRKSDNKEIQIECKLSKNDSFQNDHRYRNSNYKLITRKHTPSFSVKCMRSRTVGDNEQAEKLAVKYGVTKKDVLLHKDNYTDVDFDFVITSMGNSFWVTIAQQYTFNGNNDQLQYMKSAFPAHFESVNSLDDFKQKTYDFLLIAKSRDIKVSTENGIACARKECFLNGSQLNCGFIPNYPTVILPDVANGTSPWKIVQEADLNTLFDNYLDETS